MKSSNHAIAVHPVRKAKSRKLNRVGSRAPHIAQLEPATIGERITKRRMELNLKQDDVARQVLFCQKSGRAKGTERQLSRATLAMYEIGQAEPDLQKIEQIAKALGVSPGWLAFGEQAPVGSEARAASAAEPTAAADGDIRIETWVEPQTIRANTNDIPTAQVRTVVVKLVR